MKREFGALIGIVILAALDTGCSSSPGHVLNLYVVDALNGSPMEGVRVEHRPAKDGVVSVLTTDSAGRIDGLNVHRDD